MLDSIKSFFESRFVSESSFSADSETKTNEQNLQLASAALMVEVILSDFEKKPEEKQALLNIVQRSFKLDENEALELIKLAEDEHDNSTDYFQFTQLINQNYSAIQRIQLIENLWQIAYSDNILDRHEEHVIRRISDLIYVSHSDFMASKLRVINKNKN